MPTIRAARPSDLPDILSMIRALCAFHGDEASVTLAQLQAMFFETGRASALVAEAEDLVGYAGLTRDTVIHEAALRIDIHHLYVRETYRARGIGTALISAARDVARKENAARLTIGTDPRNQSAIAAYRAMPLLQEKDAGGPRFRIKL